MTLSLTRTSTSKVLVSCSDLMLTSFCTSRAAFVASINLFTIQVYTKNTSVHKISFCMSVHKSCLLYKHTQNQFTTQVNMNPVGCTSVHKNRFTVQVYTKPVYKGYTKTVTNKWNVHGRNITNFFHASSTSAYLYLPLPNCACLCLPLPFTTFLYLSLPASSCEIQFQRQSDTQTDLTFALLELLLCS